jgi:hypothetical protein
MPKYFEYVFSAYAIWIAAFVIYFGYLFLKSRRITRALERLSGDPGEPADSP